MIKVGLLSDTHGYWDEKLTSYLSTCNEVWHAGDIGSEEIIRQLKSLGVTLRLVYGNIDSINTRKLCTKEQLFNLEGFRIYITHIGGYPNKYPYSIKKKLFTSKPDIFVCGHSHILKIIYDKHFNFLYLNPGAVGKQGFHTKRTIIQFQLSNKEIHNMQIVEMSKK